MAYIHWNIPLKVPSYFSTPMSRTLRIFLLTATVVTFLGGLTLLVVLYINPSLWSLLSHAQHTLLPVKYGTDNYFCPEEDFIVGIDVSHHQGQIEWNSVLEQHPEVQFAYLRVSYGNSKVDRHYRRNVEATSETGLKTGGYHYYRPNTPSEKQFVFFNDIYQPEAHELPVVLDIEELGKYGVENMRAGLTNWLKLAEAAYGHRPVLYTSISFYQNYLKGHFEEYPIWLAGYSQCPGVDHWHMHQYSSKGRLHGIEGPVDLNRMKRWPAGVSP